MLSHDPREQIRGLHQVLISDKKRIGFLFGAGSSYATGIEAVHIPAIQSMTQKIVDAVIAHSALFEAAVSEMQAEAAAVPTGFNIESFLSTIEAKRAVVGNGRLNGLSADELANLAKFVKTQVIELVSVHKSLSVLDRKNLAHAKLSNWIAKARRRYPAEIFTTNYDYLFEIALEVFGMPYFDGFSGSFEPFFCPEAVEDIDAYPHLVKLWKMHGSLGWTYRESDKAVIRQLAAEDDSILIYPSHLKYSTAKKQPYVGLIDRLCTFLQQDDAVLFTCGYSFGDNHINERIVTSLRRGANSHVVALYFDETADAAGNRSFSLENEADHVREMAIRETAGKMSVYGRRHAVIGGKFGEWKLRDEPKATDSVRIDQYFDEDAAIPVEELGEHKGNEMWTGTGCFLLPDFRKLANFLDDLSTSTGPASSL